MRKLIRVSIPLSVLALLVSLGSIKQPPRIAAQSAPPAPSTAGFVPTIPNISVAVPAADPDLPPVYSLPPDEVVQPGTLAEVKNAARELGYGPKVVKAPEAWAKNSKAKGAGIKIAVLDTGADVNHPWIKDNIKGTYNAINKTRDVRDGNNHGTHVAGTIVEAAPEVELFIIKVLSDRGSGSVVDIAHGIDYAVSVFKVDIISMSLGGGSPDSYMPPAIQRAEEAGVLVICAAGNEGPGANTDGWPARYAHVISVGATDENNQIARFSSRGISLYTACPGVNIVSSLPNNRSGSMSGTSMATPLNAAGAAIWCATNTVDKVRRPDAYRLSLKNAGTHPQTRSTTDGYGIPNFTSLVPGGTPPVTPPAPGKPFSVTITLNDLSEAKKAEMTAAGVNTLSLTLGGSGANTPLPEQPLPVPPPTTPAPAPSPSPCPGGACPTVYSQPSTGVQQWQPFGGIFRRR